MSVPKKPTKRQVSDAVQDVIDGRMLKHQALERFREPYLIDWKFGGVQRKIDVMDYCIAAVDLFEAELARERADLAADGKNHGQS